MFQHIKNSEKLNFIFVTIYLHLANKKQILLLKILNRNVFSI